MPKPEELIPTHIYFNPKTPMNEKLRNKIRERFGGHIQFVENEYIIPGTAFAINMTAMSGDPEIDEFLRRSTKVSDPSCN